MKQIPASSAKSMTGIYLVAQVDCEAGISVWRYGDQILPPTINQEAPDPECAWTTFPNAARKGVGALCSIEFVWVWRYKRCAHFFSWWTGKIADSADLTVSI